MQPDMQLDSERIADFKTAQALIDSPDAKGLERQQVIAFHEERLNWRLRQAFEDHRHRLPAVKRLNRAGVKAKPRGFA